MFLSLRVVVYFNLFSFQHSQILEEPMTIANIKKESFYPSVDLPHTKKINDEMAPALDEVGQCTNQSSETPKAISCTDYHSAKEIIISMKSWLAEGESCFDKFSTEQKTDLLSEIVQVKATLHLVEQWIIWVITHRNRSTTLPKI